MGVVFAAFDRQRLELVALKTLFNTSPDAVSHLKREFRALADVTHPNLVGLYELVAEHGECFYTMELVDGVDFLRAVRERELDIARLGHVIGQVAEGVMAIHHAGKLHRDLKPSNVLVTPASRAVLLDFGIVAEPQTFGAQGTFEEGLVGTLPYMAPEQMAGRAETASDWYSVGVMLYQALTGRLPYTGSAYQIMADKCERDPEPPDTLASELPRELVALCTALLARDPANRPDGGAVLARLGRQPRRTWAAGTGVVGRGAMIGRGSQLRALEEALRDVKPNHAVVACLHGSSGSGKSTLMQWFSSNRLPAKALLLQSRCYVRESVPYKALDGIIEQLSWHLHSLPAKDLSRYLPQRVSALVHVFPVLDWLVEARSKGAPAAGGLDPIQVRRDAFDALREVLRRLATDRPLVLIVDDLQWGDAESALALEELLGQPGQPGALIIVSFRTEDITHEPFLQSLIDRARGGDTWLQVREIELGPLADDESRELAARFIADVPASEANIDEIVKESRGVPFLVELLARYVSTAAGTVSRRSVTVDDMIAAALRDLPDGCRDFMEAVTVAARPIDSKVVGEAAGVVGDERRLVGALQGAYLLRPAGSPATVEPYHDRIRNTLLRQMPSTRLAAIHLSLARAMETRGIDEPETLSEHYLEAGERGLAATHAARAAVMAGRKLAFERAATLYRRALELGPEADDHPLWHVGLADALASAGRGVEAAGAYLSAATIAGVDTAAMHRAAADQLLRCGHIQEGLAVVDTLAADARFGAHRRRLITIARVLLRRAWLRLRGWRFTERPEHTIDPARLTRIDLGLTLAAGLARVDGIRAADYQSFAATLALEAGEPVRVAHAMLGEAAFRCLGGSRTRRETQSLLSRAAALADRLQHPHLNGLVHLVRCMAFAHNGQFAAARQEAERGEHIFRQQCVGVWRDIDLAQAYTMLSLYYLGELAELGRRVPRRLQEAKDHDDYYAAADATGRPNILWLAQDDVRGARDALADIRQPDAAHQLDWPDWLRLFAETQADLYAGQPMSAWKRLKAESFGLARTTVMWVQSTRIEAAHLRARCALAAAGQVTDARPFLEEARRGARRLRREQVSWADAFADLIAAAAADHMKQTAAVDLTARALERLELCGLLLYAAAVRRRYGALVGGASGQQAIEAADAWMKTQGVVAPVRMTAMLAPGFRD